MKFYFTADLNREGRKEREDFLRNGVDLNCFFFFPYFEKSSRPSRPSR